MIAMPTQIILTLLAGKLASLHSFVTALAPNGTLTATQTSPRTRALNAQVISLNEAALTAGVQMMTDGHPAWQRKRVKHAMAAALSQ